MSDDELAAERKKAHEAARSAEVGILASAETKPTSRALVVFAWILVGLPLAWGAWITLQKASALVVH